MDSLRQQAREIEIANKDVKQKSLDKKLKEIVGNLRKYIVYICCIQTHIIILLENHFIIKPYDTGK